MIFNYRMCISHVASIARPIPSPAGPRLGRAFSIILYHVKPVKSHEILLFFKTMLYNSNLVHCFFPFFPLFILFFLECTKVIGYYLNHEPILRWMTFIFGNCTCWGSMLKSDRGDF